MGVTDILAGALAVGGSCADTESSFTKVLATYHSVPTVAAAPVPSATVRAISAVSSEFSGGVLTSQDNNKLSLCKIERELESYLQLEDGWDGYGGEAPSKDSVFAAIGFLKKVKESGYKLPKPMVSGDGEVGLYWDYADCYIDVGFEELGEMTFYAKDSYGEWGEDHPLSVGIPHHLREVLIRLSQLSIYRRSIDESFLTITTGSRAA